MKKILAVLVAIIIIPKMVFAYSVDTSGMSSDIANLINELEDTWPVGLDEGRIEVIRQAGLMINKGTKYLWGGGHSGVCETGTPDGLDCSGYVSLVFHRAGVNDVECGWTTGSFATSSSFYNINESNLRPGDIALNNDTTSSSNHVGIFVGRKNGKNIWFHSSTYNGVSGPQVREGNGNFAVFKSYSKWNEVHVNSSSGPNTGIGGELGGSLIDPFDGYKLIGSTDNFTCENIFYTVNSDGSKSEKSLKIILDGIFALMKILAPVITIVLTVIDYIKSLTNNSSESIKKANIRMVKRVAITILVVFLPYLLELLFNIFGLYDLSNCGIS